MNNHDEIMEEVTCAAAPDSVGYHYQVALLQPHFLNQKTNNPEVNLSEQSVKEHNSSLLLMIDSHHQH